MTTMLFGHYTAEFKLTPTKFAAIEQAAKKQIRQKTPSPKKQKALAILGIEQKPAATVAAADEYPKVIANEGLLFPFHYFNPAQNGLFNINFQFYSKFRRHCNDGRTSS